MSRLVCFSSELKGSIRNNGVEISEFQFKNYNILYATCTNDMYTYYKYKIATNVIRIWRDNF